MTGLLKSVAAVSFAAFLVASPAVGAETFRLAHHHAVGGAVDQAAKKFADLVQERSEGELTVQVFPGAQLGQEREAYDLVNHGAVDISITSTGILSGVFPEIAVTSLPFTFRDWGHVRAAYNGDFGNAIIEGVRAASDTEILAFTHLGFRDLMFTSEAPLLLAGMSGKRMRSPEDFVWIRMFELLGARPTPVSWGEVYTAMQTGVAEGLDTPPASALDMKFNEVTRSLLKTGHIHAAMVVAMNKGRFGGLSEEHQAILKEAATEMENWSTTTIAIPNEETAYERLQAAGVDVVDPENPEEWQAAMSPLVDEMLQRTPGIAGFLELLPEQ